MANEKKPEIKTEAKKEEQKEPAKAETKKPEAKAEKKEEKKAEIKKKNYAFANGQSLRLSGKVAAHIMDMIRYKKIDEAIAMVEEFAAGKKPVRMNNREVGHRHGPGLMAGRYPINASKEILPVLKQLKANAIYNGMEIEDAVLVLCQVNEATKPYKRGGARAKRAHICLKLGIIKKEEKKTEKQNKDDKTGEKK